MTASVGWGILSTASINEKLLTGAVLSDEVDVVAIASRDAGKAAAMAARWGIARHYGTYEELLADRDVEAVYIPLPNQLHHRWTMKALRAGKHVLCEKPYSKHPYEVEEAFDEASRVGLVLSEALMFRYHPQITMLADLVHSGELGHLRLVNASFTWPTADSGDVRLDPALDGGSLLDVGVYPISAARLLAGEPQTVTAQRAMGPSGVDVRFVATMAFPDDALAHFDCGFHLPLRGDLEVVCTLGTARVADPWHCLSPGLTLTRQGQHPQQIPVDAANSYQLELEEFGRAVRGEANRLLGRNDAIHQATTLAALLQSAVSVARVDLRAMRPPGDSSPGGEPPPASKGNC